MAKDFSTCGIPYRIHEDGRVEANGALPLYETPAVRDKIAKIWQDFGPAIQAAGSKFNLPNAWLVAIIYIESSGNPRATAPCEPVYCPAIWKSGGCASQGGANQFCAGGLMAFTAGTASMFGRSIDYYVEHPDDMIMDAAQLIAVGGPKGIAYGGGVHGAQGGDILSVVKMYNGGSKCGGGGLTGHGGQGDYVSKFIRVCNTFIDLKLAPSASASLGASQSLVVFGALAFVGWVLATKTDAGRGLVKRAAQAF
jgi:hypothetical protein